MTRKHKKTADWTEGDVGIVRRLSANRSKKKKSYQGVNPTSFGYSDTLDFWHLLLILINIRAENDKSQPFEQEGPLFQFLFLTGKQAQRAGLRDGGNLGHQVFEGNLVVGH